MQVTFLGDVHARWNSAKQAIAQNPDTDLFIQVGDFGIFPHSIMPPEFEKPLWFIDGNHENHWHLQQLTDYRINDSCWYIPRGSHLKLGTHTLNCFGGADSIDKYYRTEGVDWFREEIPNIKEFNKLCDLPEADIVVTHTAPHFLLTRCNIPYKLDSIDPTSLMLDDYWNGLKKKPKYWFFGHWHQHIEMRFHDTIFKCLPCTHDDKVKAFKGFTLAL